MSEVIEMHSHGSLCVHVMMVYISRGFNSIEICLTGEILHHPM